MSKSPYGKIVPLKTTLKQVECWNFTDNSKHDLPAGTLVHINHVYDCHHTTVSVVNEIGKPIGIELIGEDGGTRRGYRFIVENGAIAAATGIPFQNETVDIVGDIIAYESGELDDDDTRKLFQKLRDKGMIGQLQGSYGRAAAAMGI